MDTSAAKTRWELENDVGEASTSDIDQLYRWDPAEFTAVQEAKPWTQDPHYFKQ